MNGADRTTYNLKIKTLLGFVELIIIIGLFLFVPAGSFNFWQAWVYSIICVGSSAEVTFIYGEQTLNFWLVGLMPDQVLKRKKLRNLYSFFPPYYLLPFSLFPHLIIVLVGHMSRSTLSF